MIEEVIVSGHSLRTNMLAVSDSLRLKAPPGRGAVEIQYTALSFQSPEKNRFRYELEGIDPDWVDAGANRSAAYNNVPPGTYRFRVTACNNDGVWNEAGATLFLTFTPYFGRHGGLSSLLAA